MTVKSRTQLGRKQMVVAGALFLFGGLLRAQSASLAASSAVSMQAGTVVGAVNMSAGGGFDSGSSGSRKPDTEASFGWQKNTITPIYTSTSAGSRSTYTRIPKPAWGTGSANDSLPQPAASLSTGFSASSCLDSPSGCAGIFIPAPIAIAETPSASSQTPGPAVRKKASFAKATGSKTSSKKPATKVIHVSKIVR